MPSTTSDKFPEGPQADEVANQFPEGPWTQDMKYYPKNVYDFDCGQGIKIQLRRMKHGYWNGYVSLPPNHPDYYRSYDHLEGISVHGGLTFSDEKGTFGFDTCHGGDMVPQFVALEQKFGGNSTVSSLFGSSAHYWTFEETKAETFRLADQFLERYHSQ